MSEPTDLPGVAPLPEPVTFARLQAHLEAANIKLTPSGENKARGRWGDNLIEISVSESKATVLQLLGLSASTVAADRETDVATFANEWHRERVWPTLIWTPTPDDALALRTVFAVDVTLGATDEQLSDYVRAGLATTSKCLAAAQEALSAASGETPGNASPGDATPGVAPDHAPDEATTDRPASGDAGSEDPETD